MKPFLDGAHAVAQNEELVRVWHALYARELWNNFKQQVSEKEATLENFAFNGGNPYGYSPEPNDHPTEQQQQEWVQLIMDAEAYFEQGYRIHMSTRRIVGLPDLPTPDGALAYAYLSSGHIAGTEAERLWWVTKQ